MPTLIDNIVMRDASNVERTVIDTDGKLYVSAGLDFEPGNQFYVDSVAGSDAYAGTSWTLALATLDAAIAKCTANNGDVIWIAPGHSETYSTTGVKLTVDVAGVTIVGLGYGGSRPTFTFSHVDASFLVSSANCKIKNLLLVTGIDSVVKNFAISGVDCTLESIEFRDTTDIEVIDNVVVTGARFKAYGCYFNGYTGGNANVRNISLNAVTSPVIERCRFLGKVTTACINFITVASSKALIKDCDFLVTSTTDLSKTVVDTITGSTWEVSNCFDLGAGSGFSGGSGAALAKDDVSAVTTAVAAVQADLGDPSARSNLQSILALLGNPDTAGATIWNKIYAGKQYATKTISTFAGGDDSLFTFAGTIKIHSIIGRVTTIIQAQATTLKLQIISDALADYDICTTKDVNAFAVGSMLSITGTAANAMIGTTGVGALAPTQVSPIVATCVTAGSINLVSGAASTGAIAWEILWEPMSAGATLAAA